MRIISCDNPRDIIRIMQEINVDKHGIGIMAPKAIMRLLKINGLSNISANILKQELLSLGADAAIARGALTGQTKKTDCLLFGSIAQLNNLCKKLRHQPFGLSSLALSLKETLNNYEKEKFILNLKSQRLNLGRRTYLMGIVNLTPDSFSGDGLYKAQSAKRKAQNYIEKYVESMITDGADIIDIGGESTRPGAKQVSIKEEINRVIPVIKKLAKKIKVPISIDTYRPEVARQALDCGAVIVNDISGLRNPQMPRLISQYRAGVVIMHMKGKPQTMQKNPKYKSLIDEIMDFLSASIKIALDAGISKDKIIIDPGIGFGKTAEDNLEIIKHLREFKGLGFPMLVGVSRKSFIGKVTGRPAQQRLYGTIAANILSIANGASIIRVHDVKEAKDAVRITDEIRR